MEKKQRTHLWLKAIRESSGLNYTEAAKLCKVTVGVYFKVETGYTFSPRIETARRILQGLRFRVERFFDLGTLKKVGRGGSQRP